MAGDFIVAALFFLNLCPYFISSNHNGPHGPLRIPKMVKHQPTPTFSIMIWRTAKAAAARAHFTILADAAAVDGLSGFRSVTNVPKA